MSNSALIQKYLPRTPLLAGDDPAAKREEIRTYFHSTFSCYESLFETLAADEAYYKKPISLRHPLIFYYGHTATFFINKLVLAGTLSQRIDPKLESICAVGVDEMSWDDLNEANYDWPRVAEVREYRNKVRATIDKLITELPLSLPISWDSSWWPIIMGIEHEQIHVETSSVLIRQHLLEYVKPSAKWQPCRQSGLAPDNKLLDVKGGMVKIGKDFANPGTYGWDNEFGEHHAQVADFKASKYLVSNQEFLAFVEDEGYLKEKYWSEEGRAWQQFVKAQHPTFWVKKGLQWHLRLMTEEVPMPWDWPVEVNYLEAKAFCNWKSAQVGQPLRLPSEDEWYRLYDEVGLKEVPVNAPAAGNLHLDHYASSCPVSQFQQGNFYDVVGNVWQWTETPIYPFQGFDVHPLYDDFTAPTFDDKHNLMKGGSWVSCGNETLRASRYAFRRHFFQHAGFRYVLSQAPPTAFSSRYETNKLLAEYAEFHYGDCYFGVANFPQAMAKLAIKAMGKKHASKALDLGCAAGRATFELARHFDKVTGVDFSARFISSGVQLVQQGLVRYALTDEGELVSYKERALKSFGLDALKDKVEFYQGDACNLPPKFTGYDLILAANLIDRLYNPAKFLSSVHERLNQGGLLIISSPYTWLQEHTERKLWVGGFKKDGENYTTLDGLKDMLGKNFRLVGTPQEVPFVIRETKRKFQHSLAEVSIWEKL